MTEELKQETTGGGTSTAVAPQPAPPTPSKQPAKKRKAKKRIKRIIGIILLLAILGGGGFAIWYFIFRETPEVAETLYDMARYSSIQSMVEGSGNARAKDTAAITLTAGGTVMEVLVSEGDMVYEGQPLYTINSQAAEEAVTIAREAVENLQREMSKFYEQMADLTVTAPFSGKLMEVGEFNVGDDVAAGTRVCTLVNDRTLKLSLYYSYAYEDSIYVGQSVQVSIPAIMGFQDGVVEKINKVDFISPEGGRFFEVVITLNNLGTLTEGMSATASMTAADGSDIYPYENSTLEFYERRDIVTKAGGPVLAYDLLNYASVDAGQVLLSLGDTDINDLIQAKNKEIEAAQEKLDEALKGLENFNAVAPIDGTVTSCTLNVGDEVKSGDTVITISNTTSMIVEITVDDRNIGFVTPGMMVELKDWNDNVFMGTVSNINMNPTQDNMGSGMTNYPVTLTVDNYDGTLLAGQWLQYSFVASQSDDCIVVPIQSVKSTTDEEGNEVSVVFLQTDTRPDNAITMPEQMPGQPKTFPTEEEGYYAVPVTTGLSDTYNVEITSGLNDGDIVFTNYLSASGSSWGMYY